MDRKRTDCSEQRLPYIVVLTGGIASGKSTVSRLFEELGVPVVDTDRISRELVEPGEPALQAIVDSETPGNVDHAIGLIENVDDFLSREVVNGNDVSHDWYPGGWLRFDVF